MRTHVATLVVSAAVSAATAFVVGRATAREAASPDDIGASLKESLRDVETALDDIRQAVAERPALATAPAAVAGPQAAPSPAGRAVSPAAAEPTTGTRAAPPADAPGPLLPPATHSRAKEIQEWETSEDVRRRWFLVSEAEALAVFGTPQSASGWESGEQWEYESEEARFTLCFLRGRLVNVYWINKDG